MVRMPGLRRRARPPSRPQGSRLLLSQELKGCRRNEDPDHGPHYDLVDAVNPALDAALADKEGHEERDHRDEPGVGSHTTLDGYEARGDPPCEGDSRVPGRHPASEGVRGVGERLAE